MAPNLSLTLPDRGGALSPRSAPPYTPYSQFHLPSDDEDDEGGSAYGNGDDDDGALPFPTALARSDFLADDFEPTAYLSSLFPSDGATAAPRHQTLEDLRTELRERSSAISAELLELINAHYTSFLGLGDELRGGDEKVEDMRVALFGFRRAIEDIQRRVAARRAAVASATTALSHTQAAISAGRRLLELDERVALLEERLHLDADSTSKPAAASAANSLTASIDDAIRDLDSDTDSDADSDTEDAFYVGSSPSKLATLARDLVLATRLADSFGAGLPLVKLASERLAKCRDTLLLDLNAALKDSRRRSTNTGNPNVQTRLLKILAVYRTLDSEEEAVRVLREK